MAEVYASKEVTLSLLDPITGLALSTSILFRRDLTVNQRPTLVERGYARGDNLSSRRTRNRGSVTLRKDADSLALAQELERWEKGIAYYPLSSNIAGKSYRHPNLQITYTQPDGTTETVMCYGVRLSERSLAASDGGIVGDTLSLDVLRGFDLSATDAADMGSPLTALSLARTGPANYISTAGSLTAAGDGVARAGLPYYARRNLVTNSQSLLGSGWGNTACARTAGQVDPWGGTDGYLLTVSAASHDIYQAIACQPGVTYTMSWYAKRGTMSGMKYSFYNATASANITSPTSYYASVGTDWTRITASVTTPAGCTSLRIYPLRDSGVSSGTCYITGVQLESGASATTYQPKAGSAIDLANALNGAGLVLEPAATNLCTSNQATGDEANTRAGFTSYGAGVTLSSDTTAGKFYQGSRALKVVADDTAANQGVTVDAVSVTAGQTYTFEAMLLGNTAGQTLTLDLVDNGTVPQTVTASVITQGSYTLISGTITASTGATTVLARLYTAGTFASTFWLDCLMWANLPMPTSWVDGSRNADLCGIVAPHQLLQYSGQLASAASTVQSPWTLTNWSIPASPFVAASDGTLTATRVTVTNVAADNIKQAVTPSTSPAGKVYTLAVKMRQGATTASVKLQVENQAGSVLTAASGSSTPSSNQVTCTLPASTGSYQTFWITVTAGATDTGLIAKILGANAAGSIDVESVRLLEGRHPGPYVKTTDTAIPLVGSAWPDAAWQQNGSLQVTIWPGPISGGVNRYFLGAESNGTAAGIFRLARGTSFTSSDTTLVFDRRHDGPTGGSGTANRGRAASSSSGTFFDGAPHVVKLVWANYTLAGIRYMPQEIWIDGTLHDSKDAAQLYGATTWTTIELSRLISDGLISSVLSNLTLGYPTLPSGAIPAV